ncbi:S8 family serine peptidase [Mycolicibacterium hodleri]|nr:S8 family serine peptidase [Mycolicibacterium hodleri]
MTELVDPGLTQQLLNRTGSTSVPDPDAAHADDLLPVIARLDPFGSDVPGLGVVSRFGGVVTARMRLADLDTVRRNPAVRSLKAIRKYGPALSTSVPEIRATPAQLPQRSDGNPLTGAGVLVAVLDWGLDITHSNFRNADGSTIVEALWDQRGGKTTSSPEPFDYGRVLTREAIDDALSAPDPQEGLGYDHADVDPRGDGTHGTHVADIAVGRGRAAGAACGVAPGAALAFVHLRGEDTAPEDTLGDSARILEACDWAVRAAAGRPLVIHMSLGRTGGPHDDTLLVTRAFDHLLAAQPGVAIVMSCGNYYDSRMHAALRVAPDTTVDLPWDVPPPPPGGTEVELWYSGRDRLAVSLIAPDGTTALHIEPGEHAVQRADDEVVASGFSRLRDPDNADNLVDLFLQPGAPPGRWTIRVAGQEVHDGRVQAWIERTSGRHQARFPASVATSLSTTGSICNGRFPLAVGAYAAGTPDRAPMPFSSAGPSRDGRPKPDVAAPGGSVQAARSSCVVDGRPVRDGLTRKSGTSMAAPHVSGTVALLFEAALPRRLPMAVTRWLVIETARPPTQPDVRYGAGLLDASAACRLAVELTAQPTPIGAAPPIRLARESEAGPPRGGTMTITNPSDSRVFEWLNGEDTSLDEAVLGTLTLNRPGGAPFTHSVDTRTPVRTATGADAATVEALTDRTGHQVVSATATGWEIAPFGPAVCWISTPVAGFDGPGLRIITINGGERVYVPVDPASPGARRVDVPGVRSFYGLPPADRTAQLDQWAGKLAGATTMTAAQARALGMPLLRAALARNGGAAFPVRRVNDDTPPKDRGGVVNGITLPPLIAPLREPDCYLPVIARAEGRMESINAWDRGAGVSLGPIQFNVDRAALFRFLWQLRTEDPDLFRSALGVQLGWDMTWHTDHPDLLITRGTNTDTLHGRTADRDTNATYLMRGVPGPGPLDPDYRRRVAGCFRDAVVWPHVQQMIVDVTSWWLGPALTSIHAAGIGPLSPTAPDQDTFVLTALLLSAAVRYSSCLQQILTRLARWNTVADKLAHLDQVIDATTSPCPKLGARLKGQRRDAATVFAQAQRLLAPPAAAGGGESVSAVELSSEGGTGFRNEWASGILGTIRSELAATGHSPETWWDGMVDPVWLGRRFGNGIHEVLLRKLQAAEAFLRRQPAYASLSGADLGRALGVGQNYGGARTGRSSMHSFGLAADIEYTASPWILANPDSPTSNEATRQACNRAALLLGGRAIDTAPPFLSGLARGGTAAAYDTLRMLNREFVAYLGLAGDVAATAVHVERNRAVAGVIRDSETVDAAATRWAEQARVDLDRMRLPGSNFHPRDPRKGFMSMHKDLVVALRDGGRLAWGAIDFGAQSGDIMHFDARPDGVGRVVLAGIMAARRTR